MKIKNALPRFGDLDSPLLRRTVSAGEVVDVTEDQARRLLPQRPNWAPADDEAQAVADEVYAELDSEATAAELLESGAVPGPRDSLAVWRAFAAREGDADADNKTKKQLIAEHGADQGATE